MSSDPLIGLSIPSKRQGDAKLDALLHSNSSINNRVSDIDARLSRLEVVQKICCDEMIKEHDSDIRTLRDNSKDHGFLVHTMGEFIAMQKEVNKANSEKIQKLMIFQASITSIFTAISIVAGFFGEQIMVVVSGAFGGVK
jgi:hypothetical protein